MAGGGECDARAAPRAGAHLRGRIPHHRRRERSSPPSNRSHPTTCRYSLTAQSRAQSRARLLVSRRSGSSEHWSRWRFASNAASVLVANVEKC
eukprot:1365185-Rhodomonas_salina.1